MTKPEIVVINKIDTMTTDDLETKIAEFKKTFGRKKKPEIVAISAAGHTGIENLIARIEKVFLNMQEK